MKRISTDQNGEDWVIFWGVLDEAETLNEIFGVSGPLEAKPETVTFQDPIYANETKSLRVFESAGGIMAAMAEITPGVYAVGVKK